MKSRSGSSAKHAVHAFLVTGGAGRSPETQLDQLGEVVSTLGEQTVRPDFVTLVAVGGIPEEAAAALRETFGDRAAVVQLSQAQNFGTAVRQALTAVPQVSQGEAATWYWLLHDDSSPEPAALQEMLQSASQGASIAVVGPKQVSWDDHSKLLELGIEATRSGRRVPLGVAKEIDQGQYDHRTDVLAVGSAGMLVRADVWKELGGLDPHLGPFGDGLEFGRRARRAGYRVIVAPKAVIAHKQQSIDASAPAASYRQRRASQLYNWMLSLPPGLPILLFPLLLLWTPARALGRLITRRPKLAAAEIGALAALMGALPSVRRGRRKDSQAAAIPRRSLRALEATPRSLEARRRLARRVRRQRQRPSELVEARTRSALAAHRRSSRLTLLAALAVTALASGYFWYPYQAGMTGGSWASFPLNFSLLWDQAWSAWVYGGVGAPGPVNTLLPLLSLLSAPFALFGITPTAVAVAALMAAMPLAALGAWLLSGSFTTTPWVRGSAALIWAFQPALLSAVGEANLSALLLWVGFPFLFTGLWRATRGKRPLRIEGVEDTVIFPHTDAVFWAAIAAIGTVVAASGSPFSVLLAAAAGALLASTAARPRLSPAWRQIGVTGPDAEVARELKDHDRALQRSRPAVVAASLAWVPAAVLVAPTLVWSLQTPVGADRWRGMLLPNTTELNPLWAVTPWWSWLPAALLLVAATAALVMSLRAAQRNGWAIISAVFVAVLLLWGMVAQPGYAPALYPAAALALLAAALMCLPDTVLRAEPTTGASTWLAPALSVLAAGSAFAGVLLVGPLGSGPDALQRSSQSAVPMVSKEAATSERAGRTLVLTAQEGKPTVARLWRQGSLQQADKSIGLRTATGDSFVRAEETLATAVGELGARPTTEAAQQLADHAVELILLTPDSDSGPGSLESNLDATEGLERIGTTDAGSMWRVRVDGVRPSEATIGGSTGRKFATSRPTVLVLAEPAAPHWHASFAGQTLSQIPDPDPEAGWRQAFQVPAGEGELTWSYSPPWLPWWKWGSLLTMALAAVLALPLRHSGATWYTVEEVEPEAEESEGVEDEA